ncbi:MAG: DUF1553 domain-containing protein [Planctomyces sp.]|nr:DUF1553 domain-containing protein [Planctomyces sp.]
MRTVAAFVAFAFGFCFFEPFGLRQAVSVPQEESKSTEFFEQRIRPVLVQHCYECHSAESEGVKGGLMLDTAEGLRAGGDSGSAIVAGRSAESLLIDALRYKSLQMPPKGKLPESVVLDFERWIDDGAPDPRIGAPAAVKKSIDFEEARRFWSFVPPVRVARPPVKRTEWAQNEIDYFLLATMEANGLEPSLPADRRELIRRATFDLIGLPPTPEEVDAFVSDASEDAFAKVVDRLLASPHYGERWGRYWLDVARYAEDQAHTFSVTPNTNGYRYRDWVISAMNSDLPFDQFVRYQIAADLISMPEEQRTIQLPALGYFGLGAQYYKNTDAAKAAADELDDRIDTLSRGFLGLTVSCARCHDHKFDPIPTQDYYSLAGVFNSSRLHNAPLVPQEQVDSFHKTQARLKELEEAVQRQVSEVAPRVRESFLSQVAQYLEAAWRLRAGQGADVKAVALEGSLNEKFLGSWVEFLSSQRSVASLANVPLPATDNLAGHTAVPEQVKMAATEFQRHLELLLKQRAGTLTTEEEAALRKLNPADKARYSSPIVTKREPSVQIDVDLQGARELYLVVTDAGDGASCDHADWAETRLVTSSGEMQLSELSWRSVNVTYGSVHLNQNVQGGPIRIGGKSFSTGLGTHSTSVIAYDLPEGVLRFRATAGLDHSGTDQGGCGEGASVQFRVYTETPADIGVVSGDLLTQVFGENGVFRMEPSEIEQHLPESVKQELQSQRKQLEELRKSAPAMYPVAHVIAEANPADMKVFIRGNPANQGDVAPRRFLRILSDEAEEVPLFRNGSGRHELAEAIAAAENPLTSRVMVNRLWQHHFGRGLVGTPDNFGQLGERPSHPELLDYLAVRFQELGWSVKAMHREMMLSSTYQQSSDGSEASLAIDADNRYLWRMNRRRLDVEAWRDALLSVSGRLDRRMGGASTNLSDADNSRRTVYAFISRHELDSMLRLFDFPDANITNSSRSETTVPQQQLFVINSPFMLNQARAFAARLREEAGEGDTDRIRLAFELAFGRPVTEDELQLGLTYVTAEDSEEEKQGTTLSRWERYTQILLASNEFLYVD